MNNYINTSFSIKDLEALSGIKAHTIRIWEKRYSLLEPNRTETNIRLYSVQCLQKLLNVSLLNNNGVKISKIAEMSDVDIMSQVKEISLTKDVSEDAINSLKLAMFKFDKVLFNSVYNSLLNKMTFREMIKDVFFPFLQNLGFLWQSDVIKPIHEHFIANLIIRKIQLNTEKIDYQDFEANEVYVLFLPENEVHQISLLYLNYELLLRGCSTVFLGNNLPLDNLQTFVDVHNCVRFVTCLTVTPYEEDMESYLGAVSKMLENSDNKFIAFGDKVNLLSVDKLWSNIEFHSSLMGMIDSI